MALARSGGGGALGSTDAGNPPPGLAAADGRKWCDRCPHGEGKVCFVDPSFEGPMPVSIFMDRQKKKALLEQKAANARRAGVQDKTVAPPKQEVIERYKKRIEQLWAKVPDMELHSDFIVGYPGETEESMFSTLRRAAEMCGST